MATLAKYEFPDEASLDAANKKIYDLTGSSSATSKSISRTTLEIRDCCKNPAEAGNICRAYGGKPV